MHDHRRIALALAVAALVLTGCSTSATDETSASATPSATASPTTASPTPSSTVKVQDSLKGITVKGDRLKAPQVSFKSPFAIDKTRVEVLVEGKGAVAQEDGQVTVHYYGVNGRTGETFDESFSNKSTVTFSLAQVITGFKAGIAGQKVGSRLLIAMPGSDAYDEAVAISADYAPTGYELGDTLIFVVDLVDTSLTEPSGKELTPPDGLPTVTSGTGRPGITIPATAAPAKMSATTLIEGTGTKIAASDTITARYVGVSWKTGKVVDDQFDTPSTGVLADTIPGWQSGLVGKKVGSRVLLVLPPEDGYPQGSNEPPLEAGDTIVYVVDLLFTASS